MYKFLCAPLASFPTVVCASTTRASGRSGKNPQNVFAVCLHVDFSFWVERKRKQHKSNNNESNSYIENLWSRKKCCGSMLEGGWFVCWMVIKKLVERLMRLIWNIRKVSNCSEFMTVEHRRLIQSFTALKPFKKYFHLVNSFNESPLICLNPIESLLN